MVFHRLLSLFIEITRHVGDDISGGDGIDAYFATGEFFSQRLGIADQTGLACSVVGLAGISGQTDDRADIDNSCIGLLEHASLESFCGIECAFEIGIQDRVPIFLAHPQGEAIAGHPGVVNQDTGNPKIFRDLFAKRFDRSVISDINSVARNSRYLVVMIDVSLFKAIVSLHIVSACR